MGSTTYELAWTVKSESNSRLSGFQYVWGSTRIVMGLIFLWAFFDKLLGLGYATAPERAWIKGGSPTYGFLTFGTGGPFAEVFQAMAGNAFVDALFMIGLLGIGVALVAGIGVKIAGYSGALMMMLMWAAALPPANNPVFDDHIVYALVLIAFALSRAGHVMGFGRAWSSLKAVEKHPILE